ncbi:MAG TPA: hypothetical protein VGL65_03905 [Gemmatimonadales bacterium]|jgi:hypothetical protein
MRTFTALATLTGVATAVGVAGCRTDATAWRKALAAPAVQHLAGSWDIVLRRYDGSDTLRWRRVAGHVALTLNDQALDIDGIGARPMVFGAFDVDFDSLGVHPGTSAGIPAVAGFIAGDSLRLVFGPATALPLELRGMLRGDSASGEWHAFQRAGPGAIGDFTLHRR